MVLEDQTKVKENAKIFLKRKQCAKTETFPRLLPSFFSQTLSFFPIQLQYVCVRECVCSSSVFQFFSLTIKFVSEIPVQIYSTAAVAGDVGAIFAPQTVLKGNSARK